MGLLELFVLAVGLSGDAFAVAVGKGLGMRKLDWRQTMLIAVFFGGFQALMPALGWLLGEQFAQFLSAVEGPVAFALLFFIGSKMLWDAFHEAEEIPDERSLRIREVLLLAIATSIDAFAAGVAFALLDVNIVEAISLIGATTFVLSAIGVMVGHAFGSRWSRPSTIAGGIVLIAIGVRILLEGL